MNNKYQVGDLLIPLYQKHAVGYVSASRLKYGHPEYEVTWIGKEGNMIKYSYSTSTMIDMIKNYNYFSVREDEIDTWIARNNAKHYPVKQ